MIGKHTNTNSIGVLATNGTVQSGSYQIEIEKFFPAVKIEQEACPMWVPLVENNEHRTEGADYFVKKHIDNILEKNKDIDTLLLACTHYPLLREKIETHLPKHVKLLSQGEIVAESLQDYLHRHPEIDERISKKSERIFYTTDSAEDFTAKASIFFGEPIAARHIDL
jgi:glutamate racemase